VRARLLIPTNFYCHAGVLPAEMTEGEKVSPARFAV